MIRAITLGLPVFDRPIAELSAQSQAFVQTTQQLSQKAGISVRTQRLTLPALEAQHENRAAISSLLRTATQLADASSMRWFCLPLDLTRAGASTERMAAVLAAMRSTPKLFVNCIVAAGGRIAAEGAGQVARLITNVASQSNNGFDNFRVGASCCCPTNAPFFPFSRHEGSAPAFSLALETSQLAQEAALSVPQGAPLYEVRHRIVERLVPALETAECFGRELEIASGIAYRGLDASFAPFPDGSASIPSLIQALAAASTGAAGTLFLTSVLTDTLRAALLASGATPRGFNGVMFSILEDEQLAAANNRRALSIEALMAFAAVCGCGLDMVPVPGNTFPEEIAAVILDVAALATRLQKPLGVRLLPIPGKVVNELTAFNLDFLCDSRVMELKHTDRAPVITGEWEYLTAAARPSEEP